MPAARGYKPRPRPQPALEFDGTIPAAGGGWSTVTELLTFAQALIDGGRGVVAATTLSTMFEPHFRLDPRLPGRGLGFHLGTIGEHRVVGHDGSVPGFSATLLVAPEARAAAVVLANATNFAVGAASHRLARDLLGQALGVNDPAGTIPTGIEEGPGTWRALTGIYGPEPGLLTSMRSFWHGTGFFVRPETDHLVVRTLIGAGRRPARLHRVDRDYTDRFRVVGRAGLVSDVVFQRERPGGRATHLCIASPMGAFHRLRRLAR